mmetsp:Transcript_20181/g.41127  ORF Transcript_20181/g.41127 Transcript_20181/m.41127 type:complete len:86 (+) Transcript_20181:218-475(+)
MGCGDCGGTDSFVGVKRKGDGVAGPRSRSFRLTVLNVCPIVFEIFALLDGMVQYALEYCMEIGTGRDSLRGNRSGRQEGASIRVV